MLDEHQRQVILALAHKGFGARRIARALDVSRGAVRDILRRGAAQVPKLVRPEKAAPYREDILALYASCKGNLVRVHEELVKAGAALSYQALTGFCRRHAIGRTPKPPAGHYDFAPGEEMQHDTSRHRAEIGERWRAVDTASLVLCFSRMTFFQFYPCFTRFECKVFLTDAFAYFEGLCGRCMVDNTSVIRLKGTGHDMVPVPEMVAFAERFGFVFAAHELGDKNRSARVEIPFNMIDHNFLAGRRFRDWDDANAQARAWCDQFNATYSPKLRASRRELFARERPALRPLPDFIPEVYVLHQRIVDAEGYVSVRRHRYSVPYQLIGRLMEVRESKQRVEVFDGPRLVAAHRRLLEVNGAQRSTLPEHRPARGEGRPKQGPLPEEKELLLAEPALADYVAALKQRAPGRGVRALQKLLRLLRDYPRAPLLEATRTALQFGLYDLDRLERLVLRQIGRDFFVWPATDDPLEPPVDPAEEEDDHA
jgi:hypothetical protein